MVRHNRDQQEENELLTAHLSDKMYVLISFIKSTPPQNRQLNILISNRLSALPWRSARSSMSAKPHPFIFKPIQNPPFRFQNQSDPTVSFPSPAKRYGFVFLTRETPPFRVLCPRNVSVSVFSTYILIDNLDNSSDRKTVRVTMEVCSLLNEQGTN